MSGPPEPISGPVPERIIVCPLVVEHAALVRAGVAGRLLCTGPGPAGMARLSGLITAEKPVGPVILAGLAGAIDGSIKAGSGHLIRQVAAVDGEMTLRPTWPKEEAQRERGRIITSSAVVVATADERCAIAAATGAQLVDQESRAFAELAIARGWTWGIVRGVSDDLTSTLPPDISTWVDETGRTRLGRVAASCVRRPWQLKGLMTLRHNSIRALTAVAELLTTAELSR